MATNKDTIDKLNRLQFFYWCKPPKTPEVLEQDKEQVERDFALIRKDLEVLEILKKYYKSDGWSNGGVIKFWEMTESQLKKIKEWLENEEDN